LARGAGVVHGENVQDVEGGEADRQGSIRLLEYLGTSRRNFPSTAKRYWEILNKAEEIWKGLAA
jgi:hypothetical protein